MDIIGVWLFVKAGKERKARSIKESKAKESLLWRFLWFNEGKETGVKCVVSKLLVVNCCFLFGFYYIFLNFLIG